MSYHWTNGAHFVRSRPEARKHSVFAHQRRSFSLAPCIAIPSESLNNGA